jgi:hypothetical protein
VEEEGETGGSAVEAANQDLGVRPRAEEVPGERLGIGVALVRHLLVGGQVSDQVDDERDVGGSGRADDDGCS